MTLTWRKSGLVWIGRTASGHDVAEIRATGRLGDHRYRGRYRLTIGTFIDRYHSLPEAKHAAEEMPHWMARGFHLTQAINKVQP